MPNVHDDDEETLWFADESEWMDADEDDEMAQGAPQSPGPAPGTR
jgi:hypothetical protein